MATQVDRPARWRGMVAMAAAGVLAAGLTACGSDSGDGDANTITVSYRQWGDSRIQENYLTGVKTEFEKANPGVTVQLEPVVASEDDYFTKLQLQMRSPRTSPDVVYEDTFLINSDIEAGYLRPLDDQLADWPEWERFTETAKGAGKALDGKTYGIPDGTDTRGLWYNKELFAQAGLPADWQPRTWDEVLTAARAIKAALPGVIPFNIYAGKAVGESASMQGFEMLLYGTGDTLYDDASQKWVVGSKGFTDSLQFIKTVYDEGLGPSAQQVLDPNWNNTVNQQLLPQGKVVISLDGSWISQNWLDTGAAPWPQWSTVLGNAAWPTQQGQAPGRVSMSGGWTWAIPQNSDNPDMAWQLIALLGDKDRQLRWAVDNVQIPVRDDVATDPSYLQANPTNEFFASLVPITTYRPAYAVYPRISNEIQVATETVITGGDVAAAAQAYDEQVRAIAGDAVQPAP
ncbi:ABC transporter substrate-binding protein [Pseudonocardia humida]|uniref:ABC transporter substrate-binding protein n=1 Tax=Pseudonocardia humida TaxID=2800819 RepID=A0ABT1A6Q4_9PSEU|nr:ABC transporter substrate-binding protein [Pseudonocardia humida]MCO1658593.1 ABC transporter substrate-binding protein [Pseudonocardia humida]